jgi:hypothetical protein
MQGQGLDRKSKMAPRTPHAAACRFRDGVERAQPLLQHAELVGKRLRQLVAEAAEAFLRPDHPSLSMVSSGQRHSTYLGFYQFTQTEMDTFPLCLGQARN